MKDLTNILIIIGIIIIIGCLIFGCRYSFREGLEDMKETGAEASDFDPAMCNDLDEDACKAYAGCNWDGQNCGPIDTTPNPVELQKEL